MKATFDINQITIDDMHNYMAASYPAIGFYEVTVTPSAGGAQYADFVYADAQMVYCLPLSALTYIKEQMQQSSISQTSEQSVSENLFLKTIGLIVNKDKPYEQN